MCLLMVCLPGDCPTREDLVNASLNNPHGFGYAVLKGDHIVVGNSMKYDELIDEFLVHMSEGDNYVGMYHARFSTHGTTSLDNTHPFKVGGRDDVILAHNGILPVYPKAGDLRSDTRIFAEDILPSMGLAALDDNYGWGMLEDFAHGSKIAILSVAEELRDQVYIINETSGNWDGNIWWSNTSYQYRPRYTTGYGSSTHWWNNDDYAIIGGKKELDSFGYKDGDENCNICIQPLTKKEIEDGVCECCNSCLDCNDFSETCMCYTPSFAKKDDVVSTQDMLDYDKSMWDY